MKRIVHTLAWLLLALMAVTLWPERWGGTMTYVITTGNSMSPVWAAGDLAILRTADDYAVGDVAAFRSEGLDGTIVMHRIVAEDGGVYRFQGDSNDFVDPDQVTDEQVLGRLLARVPRVGSFFSWFTQPLNLGIAAVALSLLLSDRKRVVREPKAEQAPVRHIHVSGVDIPASAIVAHILDQGDLLGLARLRGVPVLTDEPAGLAYVHDGTVLYRYCSAEVDSLAEDRRGSGRDWNYGVREASHPRPRRQAVKRPRHPYLLG